MRSFLCTQNQNIKSKWRRLRLLSINQELEKKTFTWKQVSFTIFKDYLEDWEMQSFTFSLFCITSLKLITVSCISMVLSPM